MFFKRLTVEMQRRAEDPKKVHVVFLADGANLTWDRFKEIAPENATFIIDFYHACEHVSDLCKQLYGEQTREYWKHFKAWKAMLSAAKSRGCPMNCTRFATRRGTGHTET